MNKAKGTSQTTDPRTFGASKAAENLVQILKARDERDARRVRKFLGRLFELNAAVLMGLSCVYPKQTQFYMRCLRDKMNAEINLWPESIDKIVRSHVRNIVSSTTKFTIRVSNHHVERMKKAQIESSKNPR